MLAGRRAFVPGQVPPEVGGARFTFLKLSYSFPFFVIRLKLFDNSRAQEPLLRPGSYLCCVSGFVQLGVVLRDQSQQSTELSL